ncbi:hypothetical protein A3K29_02600 [Candidatus Collierbacteria bacterium RIFOXYB2_FULL_46_14]|uniref:Peptidase M23 n=1 Tax=Candidatus Collierbacteria bacterium GW2011_GWA2_46_26 TaxID=1618381 RepID=A0A0G1RVB7_9BACT|nr:MAG: Peptidase M23 [Candidatus Collierbacteria bacterium GW2011_GWC2_44_13]KKU33923.1 MAG: Peptidase M23 [Candidatus Collierbacteria bacterium GW2011_GWA2_46_26]OGD73009.1 MAG: hypothetical protein A3K29_02600 [Candidatus Collierbacteria bacterium RIFOXYB2_FULL_46_14]OGD76051.1 MAG: hypothetical protein A3K43_02600 [Candidatus Collierbacteria bacterium RIFOXYA2_FULL_46_20]OGD77387.1 MAG: hypothetical protein A3K39_02600 [Candidatus Collierbacteria bacterium RIFOXYC2_FULL_43_15]OGD80677.1 MA
MKKVCLLLAALFFLMVPTKIFAVNCDDKPADNLSQTDLETFWKDVSTACATQIAQNRNDQNTLKQAISSLNAKINLTQAQINQTTVQIASLEKDITVLSGVLETVNQSVIELTQIYLARVKESYRRTRITPVDLIFSTNSFGDYFTKLKYLNSLKAKDQLILAELENSRKDYDLRKQTKITKQLEIEKLKTKLITQQKVIVTQQKDKQSLLASTQNDEKRFQDLLKQANAQVAAFKKFTSGATPLSNQTHCDGWGCYYSQRDSAWFYHNIGNSPEILGQVGCLITSTAMVASHYGKSLKPSDIASSNEPFFLDTAYMKFDPWSVNGVQIIRSTISKDKADEEINAGRPVIAGLNTGNGTHFIVLKGKDGDNYIMNDPYMENGYDKPFSGTYNLNQVFRFDKVSVN